MSQAQETDPLVINDQPGAVLTRHRRPLHALTGIRFFAASWVVLFHTRAGDFLDEHAFHHAAVFVHHGYVAVALFFVLSGFILAYTYRDQGTSSTRFWQARFARLWPAWVLSMILFTACYGVPRLTLILAATCMVQAWNPVHPEYAGACNIAGWTISIEAFFYLIFPLLQRWLQRQSVRTVTIVLVAMLAVAIAIDSADVQLGPPFPFGHWIPFPIYRVPEFILGVAMGNLFLMEGESGVMFASRARSLLTYTGAVLFLVVGCTIISRNASWILIPIVLLLFGLAGERSMPGRVLGSRLVVFGGAISYSMYLLQMTAKYISRPLMGWLHIDSLLLTMVSVPMLLIAMAIPAYLLVEEPSRRALRALFARLDARTAFPAK